MSKNNLTIFQKLTKVFGYQNGENSLPTFNFTKDELLKTDSREDYEKALLQAQQSQYLADKWTKIDQSLYNQSVYYEPNRLSAYYDYESMEFSLHGDTKIATPNGYIPIKELADKGRDYEFIVYSYDHTLKKVVPAFARNAHHTRDDLTYKIVFDNNSYIIASKEHRFLKRDGTFCKVKDLVTGDSMMPFYRNSFYNNKNENWIYTCNSNEGQHGWVSEHNLITEWYHKIENNKPQKNDVENINFKKIPWDLLIEVSSKNKTIQSTADAFGVTVGKIRSTLRTSGFKNWKVFMTSYGLDYGKIERKKRQTNVLNHKIVSIEPYGVVPVYDLTVPGYKNFATDSIFSHNTPEISASLDIYAEESCLDGSTFIPLLSGIDKTIKELYEENFEDFWVYGVSLETNEIKPTKIEKVIYKGVKDIHKLTLDDDSEILCTIDHKWLLSNNSWVELKDIKHGMSLKSIYQKNNENGYEEISTNDSNGEFTHKVVSIEYVGKNDVYDLLNSSIDSTFGVKCNNGMVISHNCTMSEKGEILTIYSESKRIKSILEDLFKNTLDINTNLQMWARGMCKYGDDFVYLKIDPEKGVIGCQQLPNIEIERIEGSSNDGMNTQLNTSKLSSTKELRFAWKNKDIEFQSWEMAHFRILGDDRKLPYGTCLKSDTHIETTSGYKEIKDIEIGDEVFSFDVVSKEKVKTTVLDTVSSGEKLCYKISTENNFIEASKEHRILYYDTNLERFDYKNTLELKIGDLLIINLKNENGYVLDPIISIDEIGTHATYDIYVENENHNFYANGIVVHNSMLDKIRRIWKQLLLAEDAMLIYRTSRAPERRVFKVFVGNMDDKDVEPYVQRVANKFKRDQIVDQRNGQVDMRYNQMAVDQDFFIPVRDLSQTSPIETLPGAQNLGEIADIEYIQKKLLAALRIPKAFLGFEEVVGDGKNLALMDIRFARTINRIQKSLIQELNKIAIVHLYILGLDDELHNFNLSLTNPSAQSDLLRIEQWKEKITLYKDATSDQSNMGILPTSHTWAKKNILGMSDNEIILDLQQQRLERAIGFELTNTQIIIKRSGVFDEVDKKYGIPEEERQKIENTQQPVADVDGGMTDFGGLSDMGEIPNVPTETNMATLSESFSLTPNKKINELFDFNKAQQNIYHIENKINEILKKEE